MKARYVGMVLALWAGVAVADVKAPKPASEFTRAAHREALKALPSSANQDNAEASRGLIAHSTAVIKNAQSEVVWDGGRFGFIQGPAPETVHPSLWQQEKLNNHAGLFKVTEGIYQLRGWDIANMTLVAGKTGWIVIDPLLSAEVARQGLAFAMQHLGKKPVVAVIYTHSHADHFGGVRGVVDEAELNAGRIKVYAPVGFMEHAVAENVLAGNAMSRRAQYQFGTSLPFGTQGAVGVGLGKALSVGTVGLVPPTDIITATGEKKTIDGIEFIFQLANGSEAPAEMAFAIPEYRALCLSEIVTANMHNIYTLRGAQVRDSLNWSKYINQMLDFYPEVEVAFRSHHWPLWGNKRIRQQLVNQRDMYRYIHDATLRQANFGHIAEDIAQHQHYPKALKEDASTRGYYGTLSHNMRGVYQFYLGFYNGNPAHLDPLPSQEKARLYVETMGGKAAVMAAAKAAAAKGNYRAAVTLGHELLFTAPEDVDIRLMQADHLEQLGYQSESGVWRNEYLQGARELRHGIEQTRTNLQSLDILKAMSMDMLFDFIAVRMNHSQLDGQSLAVLVEFSDSKESWALELSNGVLHNTKGRVLNNPDATLKITRSGFLRLLAGAVKLPQLLENNEAQLGGNALSLMSVFGGLAQFRPNFPVVTPVIQ